MAIHLLLIFGVAVAAAVLLSMPAV